MASAGFWPTEARGDVSQLLHKARTSVPDHALLKQIGVGSYGEVWLARSAIGTLRAVKIVRRETFWHDHPFDREFKGIQKFEPLSRSHDGLVDILQIGRGEGYVYYVMELADAAEPRVVGDQYSVSSDRSPTSETQASDFAPLNTDHCSLVTSYTPRTLQREIAHHRRLPVLECMQIGLSLTSALEHLHRNGLVHRDVKPANIIFVGGVPKLADIGLVAEVAEARSYVGTEGFIPPEGPGSAQADLYSLGKLLYEISTGKDRHAFPELPADLAEQGEAKQLVELNVILLKACQNDVRERYQSAEEMLADLLLLKAGKSVKRKRAFGRRWKMARDVAVGAMVLALIGAGAMFAFSKVNQTRPLSSIHKAERLYKQAAYFFQSQTPESVREAYTNLTEAVRLDPRFVDAHYKLFEIYMDRWGENLPPHYERGANMRAVAARLRELNSNSAQYHTANSWLKFGRWQFDDAIAEVRLAIQVDP